MKTCPKCLIASDESKFHKNKSLKDGLARLCKECQTKARRESYLRSTEIHHEKSTSWYARNVEKVNARAREHYKIDGLQKTKLKQQRRRDELRDSYLKKMIQVSIGACISVPDSLIELNRLHIQIKRLIKEMKNESH